MPTRKNTGGGNKKRPNRPRATQLPVPPPVSALPPPPERAQPGLPIPRRAIVSSLRDDGEDPTPLLTDELITSTKAALLGFHEFDTRNEPAMYAKGLRRGTHYRLRKLHPDDIDHDASFENPARARLKLSMASITKMMTSLCLAPAKLDPLIGHYDPRTKKVVLGIGIHRFKLCLLLGIQEIWVLVLEADTIDQVQRDDLYNKSNMRNGETQTSRDFLPQAMDEVSRFIGEHGITSFTDDRLQAELEPCAFRNFVRPELLAKRVAASMGRAKSGGHGHEISHRVMEAVEKSIKLPRRMQIVTTAVEAAKLNESQGLAVVAMASAKMGTDDDREFRQAVREAVTAIAPAAARAGTSPPAGGAENVRSIRKTHRVTTFIDRLQAVLSTASFHNFTDSPTVRVWAAERLAQLPELAAVVVKTHDLLARFADECREVIENSSRRATAADLTGDPATDERES